MKLKGLQLLMLAFIWLIILLCSKNFAAVTTSSSTVTVYVDPQESIGTIGENFTINICVSDVVDLYGWEFKLGWNASVLDAVELYEGPFLKSVGSTFFTYKINNTLGYTIVDCTLLGNVAGAIGSGVLTTIKFYVKTLGESPLDLYDTILINSAEQAIEHTAIDGEYYTSVHDVAIINLTASSTNVNVTVENQGTYTETFNISAYYTRLTDPLIGTQTITLAKGTTTTLTFTWNPPSAGRYEIKSEATMVPGETDVADNTYTIIIQVGYSASNVGRTTNTTNGFYVVIGVFLFTSVIILPQAFRGAKRTRNYILLPTTSNMKDPSGISVWQDITLKQLTTIR